MENCELLRVGCGGNSITVRTVRVELDSTVSHRSTHIYKQIHCSYTQGDSAKC